MEAFEALGRRGLDNHPSKVIDGSAIELPPDALPKPEEEA